MGFALPSPNLPMKSHKVQISSSSTWMKMLQQRFTASKVQRLPFDASPGHGTGSMAADPDTVA